MYNIINNHILLSCVYGCVHTYVCFHLIMLNHMFHLCPFGVCSTCRKSTLLLPTAPLEGCQWNMFSLLMSFSPHFLQFKFFYTSLQMLTQVLLYCVCAMYIHGTYMLVLYVYLCSSALRWYTVPSIHGAFMEVWSIALSLPCICCVGLPIYWKGGCLLTQCDYDLCMCMHWLW